jgi:hypothetical protein
MASFPVIILFIPSPPSTLSNFSKFLSFHIL